MNIKYVWGSLALVIGLILAAIMYWLKPNSQPAMVLDDQTMRQQKIAEHIASIRQKQNVSPSPTPNAIGIETHRLKNSEHIRSLYDGVRHPDFIAATEKKYKHFLKTGRMMPGNARENYFSDKLLALLQQEHVSKEEVISALGYEPRSYQSDYIQANYALKINALMGVNNSANYAIYKNPEGAYLAVNQVNIHNPNAPTYVSEVLMKEFINVLLGPERDVGAVYQYYAEDQTHILSFILNNESFSLYATDISKDELFHVANDLIRLVEQVS